MWRIAIVLLASAGAAVAQPNCDPALGAIDTSCLEEKPAPARSKAKTAKEALREFFGREFTSAEFKRDANSASLELCHDLCDLYRATRLANESDVWDLAFLHQYYFAEYIGLDEFRDLYAGLSGPILKLHGGGCGGADEKALAKCVVEGLAKKLAAVYWFVRTREGHRCENRYHLTGRGDIVETVCREVGGRRSPKVAAAQPLAIQGEAFYRQAQELESEGKGPDAVKAYTRAARSGSGEAALRLALIYRQGIPGVAPDQVEAEKWANAARALGQR